MNEKKRIAFFIPSMTIGGAQRAVLNLANEFVNRDYAVDLVLIRFEGDLLEQVSDNIRIIDLESDRARWSIYPLAKYLKQEKPASMLSAMTSANVVAIISNILLGKQTRLVASEHALSSGKPSSQLNILLAKHLYKYADLVVGVSQGVSEDILKWSRITSSKIQTIYNPIVNKSIIQNKDNRPNHSWYSNSEPIIMGCGRHTELKGFDTLLRSFNNILENKDAKLVIAGRGDATDELINLSEELGINERVYFPGFVDVYPYMTGADVFVLSSKREAFGNVLVEAMACGTSVVSTRCRGPIEILKNGKYGSLVPVCDPGSMAQAINRALEEPHDSERLRTRAADFSIDIIASEYEKIF